MKIYSFERMDKINVYAESEEEARAKLGSRVIDGDDFELIDVRDS